MAGLYDAMSGTVIKDLSYKKKPLDSLVSVKNVGNGSDWFNDDIQLKPTLPVNSQPSLFGSFTESTRNSNPLAVTEVPVAVPTNTGTVAGQGNQIVQKTPSLAMSQEQNQTTPLETQPTMNGQQMPLSGQPQQPLDIGLNQDSNMYGTDFNNGLANNSFGGLGKENQDSLFGSLSKNMFDFSSTEATKNSLGNLATATNIGSSLFGAYSNYKIANAQADYQNRVASLYENKYKDDKARLAKAQANYDASFKA